MSLSCEHKSLYHVVTAQNEMICLICECSKRITDSKREGDTSPVNYTEEEEGYIRNKMEEKLLKLLEPFKKLFSISLS